MSDDPNQPLRAEIKRLVVALLDYIKAYSCLHGINPTDDAIAEHARPLFTTINRFVHSFLCDALVAKRNAENTPKEPTP